MTLKIYPSTYIHRESLFLKYVFKKIFIFFIQPLKQDLKNLSLYLYPQGKLVFEVCFQKNFYFFHTTAKARPYPQGEPVLEVSF